MRGLLFVLFNPANVSGLTFSEPLASHGGRAARSEGRNVFRGQVAGSSACWYEKVCNCD